MSTKLGIDLGSTAIKIVFVQNGEITWKKVVPTVPGQQLITDQLIDQGLEQSGIDRNEIDSIAVSGYGKKLITNAEKAIDEISANAIGAYKMSGGTAKTIINIGGQDLKIITLNENGTVHDFKMNDKCAAGTGRFLELAARILDTPLCEFSELSREADEPVNINNICAVFAESEIVSLLSNNVNKNNIIKGVHHSVARRISSLVGHRHLQEPVFIDGGPAQNAGLIEAIEEELVVTAKVLPIPQYTVAYGATILTEK